MTSHGNLAGTSLVVGAGSVSRVRTHLKRLKKLEQLPFKLCVPVGELAQRSDSAQPRGDKNGVLGHLTSACTAPCCCH